MLNVEVMKPVEASFVVPSSELKKEINVSECELELNTIFVIFNQAVIKQRRQLTVPN
jgi:hypothetical protein